MPPTGDRMPSLPFVLDLTALPRAALQGGGGEPGLGGPADCSEVVFLLQCGGPETLKPLVSAQAPQWRCYARLVTPQHVFLTFLPATFSGTAPSPSSLAPRLPHQASQQLTSVSFFLFRRPAPGCLWPGGTLSRGDKAKVWGLERGRQPERSGRTWGEGCKGTGPHTQCHPSQW